MVFVFFNIIFGQDNDAWFIKKQKIRPTWARYSVSELGRKLNSSQFNSNSEIHWISNEFKLHLKISIQLGKVKLGLVRFRLLIGN